MKATIIQKPGIHNLQIVQQFVSSITHMGRLAWRVHPWGLMGLIAVELTQGLVPLGIAWTTKAVFDLLILSNKGINSADPIPELILLLIGRGILTVLSRLLLPVGSYLKTELLHRITLDIKFSVYEKITGFRGIAPFESPEFHDTLQHAAIGAQQGPTAIFSVCMTLIRNVLIIASFIGVLLSLSFYMFIALGVALLPQIYMQSRTSHARFDLRMNNSLNERRALYCDRVLSETQFAREIRLFGMAGYFLQMLHNVYSKIHQAEVRQQLKEFRWQMALALISSLFIIGAFGAVVLQALAGHIGVGDVTLYVNAVSEVHAALSSVVFAVGSLNESVLFYDPFTKLLAMKDPLALPKIARPIPTLCTAIELRNVSFRYSEHSPWILRNVSLTIPSGKCLGLVGLNGAGKTTLVKLLVRFYDPVEGEILWDGIDIREFDPIELRKRIGAVFQDFVRYDLTVQENIGLGQIESIGDISRIQAAAIKAGIHDMIDDLPQGYETVLSRWLAEAGRSADLSGGQWQKLALARMFMRDAELLVLDEPTAALDAQAEYDIFSRFANLVSRRTCLLISHRFSTVRQADMVAVLENGRVIEQGSHDKLLELGGRYAQLYQMQADQYQ